ncbi:MAG: site-specific integrase, partial [Actinomycetota bacterium]|nr:site-specific integrase [Actinomycetota bacterium]
AGPNAATNHQLARVTVDDLTEDNLAAVASALVADGYAASTRARMLSAWRGLCRWLVRHGHLTSDPALGFETPAASPSCRWRSPTPSWPASWRLPPPPTPTRRRRGPPVTSY